MGDTGGQHTRLAGAGSGQHQHRAIGFLDRGPLLGVQPVEIGGPAPARSSGGDAVRSGGRPIAVQALDGIIHGMARISFVGRTL